MAVIMTDCTVHSIWRPVPLNADSRELAIFASSCSFDVPEPLWRSMSMSIKSKSVRDRLGA